MEREFVVRVLNAREYRYTTAWKQYGGEKQQVTEESHSFQWTKAAPAREIIHSSIEEKPESAQMEWQESQQRKARWAKARKRRNCQDALANLSTSVAQLSWLVRDNREPGSGIQQKASLVEFIKVDFY